MDSYYAVQRSGNDLEHKSHKYIDKVRTKNGKWRYIYTSKPSLKARLGVYAKEKMEEDYINKEMANSRVEQTKNNDTYNNYKKELKIQKMKWKNGKYFDKDNPNTKKEEINKLDREINRTSIQDQAEYGHAVEEGKQYERSMKTYLDSPIGKVESTIDKGREKASELLGKLADKLKPEEKNPTVLKPENNKKNKPGLWKGDK